MKCTSRILKEYKTKKADCMWPETVYGPSDVDTLPVCGGNLKISIEAQDEATYGGHYATLRLEVICSRCKHGYFPNLITFQQEVEMNNYDITALLEKQ